MAKPKKQIFKGKIELISKAPFASSGPRGIDVYTRLLSNTLSALLPHNSLVLSREKHSSTQVDLVHYTFFDPFFLTLWGRVPRNIPFVVTVHDLIPLRFPSHFPPGVRGKLKWFLQKKALKKASGIITDSFASQSDITKYLGIPKSNIHVVPLAAGNTVATVLLMKTVKTEYKLPSRFILYVGDINWNKNILSLIKSMAEIKSSQTHLVLVGKAFLSNPGSPEAQAIHRAIKESSASKRIHLLGFIPGHHLSAIYRLATLYVQPSWYEGFGFPVIEALTQGTPVLSSNQGSLVEVGGSVVHYFDPNKKSDLTQALSKLLTDPALRTKYVKDGLIWVKQFRWKNVGAMTLAVYEKYL